MSDQNSPPDGAIDSWMTKLFGRSWKTTTTGLLTFGCGVVVAADHFVANPVLHAIAGVCVATGLAGAGAIGISAKDKNVSGSNRR